MKNIQVADLTIGNDRPLTILAGPCQLESADHAQMIAGTLKETCDKVGAQFVFKASYDKANRTSIKGVRGPGMGRRSCHAGQRSQDNWRARADRCPHG